MGVTVTRRDLLRCVGLAIAAIVAGKPIAAAWLAALEQQRRREMILAQMTYQASQAMRAMMRDFHRRHFDDQVIAWNGEIDPHEWYELDDVGVLEHKFMLQDVA